MVALWIVVCSSVFFFFKQKTAYEMRISDWSSDVCSSDLVAFRGDRQRLEATESGLADDPHAASASRGTSRGARSRTASAIAAICAGVVPQQPPTKIGRASGRERVCQSV